MGAIQQLLQAVSDLALLISNVSQGLSLSEAGELLGVLGDLKDLLADSTLIIPEFTTLTPEDKATLISFIESNVNFPADITVQQWLQQILEFGINLSGMIKLAAKLGKK